MHRASAPHRVLRDSAGRPLSLEAVPRLRGNGKRWWGLALFACLAVAGGGCREQPAGEVRLALGGRENEQVSFQAKTALAEYVGLSTGGAELRVTLASYPVACQSFEPPGPGQYLVTVTITAPPGQNIREVEYPWIESASAARDGGVDPPSSGSVASARSSRGSHTIKAGGYVRLTKVELAPFGGVSGLLAFEYPGDVSSPATSIRGRFTARLCRFSPGAANQP